MEELAIEMGFENVREMMHLVASVNLSKPDRLAAFKQWQDNDGTKAGLLILLATQHPAPATDDVRGDESEADE